jgi:RimJ/RimL family protein N-acetyltransferase
MVGFRYIGISNSCQSPPEALKNGYAMGMLATERLLLRGWRATDRAAFARMNADPRVMEYFPATLSRDESNGMLNRIILALKRRGWGLWAAERRDNGRFIGFIGLSVPGFETRFTPCVEIGWRLCHNAWGHGYAPEGAKAVLDFAFDEIGLERVYSFTASTNARSERVMQKIGMLRSPGDDFDHPRLPAGHPLQRHIVYRIDRPAG